MLLSEFLKESEDRLSALYPLAEARNMALLLCEDRLGVKSYTAVTEPSFRISPEKKGILDSDMSRLLRGEPLQYVLGKADFYGRKFNVSPGVLIPRPETEMLVELALERPFSRALDLCTGSGCIAWTLAQERPHARVTALDISEDALAVAKSQPFSGNSPDFVLGDILEEPCLRGEFDLIVSNPPYIMESERADMRANVLDYEPSLALFVPDSDPLVFYGAVAGWCRDLLAENGRGIVEINDKLAGQCAGLFEKAGFSDVAILSDLSHRDRYISFFNK